MRSKKHSNAKTFPSGCIVYTRTLPDFITDGDVPCKGDIDSVLLFMGETINNITDDINTEQLSLQCLNFGYSPHTIFGLTQIKINKLCEQEKAIDALQQQLEDLNLGQKKIEIDLDCFISQSDPCEKGNLYTLSQIFRLLKNALCLIRDQLTACCSSVTGTSGTSGTTGIAGTSGQSGTGGTSGTSGTTGLPGGAVRFFVGLADTPAAACPDTSIVFIYAPDVAIGPGVWIYVDRSFTPVSSSFLYIRDPDGELFHISAGLVGASTGVIC